MVIAAFRKATSEDDKDLDEEQNQRENLGPRSQQSLQVRKDSNDSASYGRFLTWGIDGVSYLGSQLKSKVDKSLSWWTVESVPGI